MRVAQMRHLALACIFVSGPALAQQDSPDSPSSLGSAGTIYELNRQDVTVPIATGERVDSAEEGEVAVPLENLATPMRCLAAWSYIAASTIRTPELAAEKHPDFTEAMASAHWQHWLKQDLDALQGVLSPDFHQRRLAAERAFAAAMTDEGERYAYRTLGTCYVAPEERAIADPTLLLRNFMVEFQGLPESFTVPVLQRQLRAFPITETLETSTQDNCDLEAVDLQVSARETVVGLCFERGGILASRAKVLVEDLDGMCRVTSTVQCENIP